MRGKLACSFPKRSRIKSSKEISAILRSGKRQRSKLISICFSKNHLDYNRFAFLVSKRHGNAVARNALKRKLREIVRKCAVCAKERFDVLLLPGYEHNAKIEQFESEYKEWANSLNS